MFSYKLNLRDSLCNAIRPLGFDLQELRLAIEVSPLRHLCPFLFSTENIYEIMDGFNSLMNGERIASGAGPLGTLIVAGIMRYMMSHAELHKSHVKRPRFQQHLFIHMACTEATHRV
ncbi:GL13137 [Drosophila persimilis]|uniref:GL13137 n=1 Tax=Drosophila persimilis TaxID=7234 RepID=B4HBI6_DROPE|nr:GL13137 [Drosophila persimilis]